MVIEVHGGLHTLTCIGCFQQYPADGFITPYLEDGDIPTMSWLSENPETRYRALW